MISSQTNAPVKLATSLCRSGSSGSCLGPFIPMPFFVRSNSVLSASHRLNCWPRGTLVTRLYERCSFALSLIRSSGETRAHQSPSARPAFLTVRRLLYSNDSFHSFSSAEFCSAYLTLLGPILSITQNPAITIKPSCIRLRVLLKNPAFSQNGPIALERIVSTTPAIERTCVDIEHFTVCHGGRKCIPGGQIQLAFSYAHFIHFSIR